MLFIPEEDEGFLERNAKKLGKIWKKEELK